MQGRLVSILVGLVGIAVATVAAAVFLVAIGLVDPAPVSLGLAAPEAWFGAVADGSFGVRVAVAVGAAVVGLFAVWIALRGLGKRRRSGRAVHVLDSDERGFVVVDARGIAIVAEEAARTAKGVVSAEVDVISQTARSVKLRLDVDVYPGANVRDAGNQARTRAREAVEELVGIEVGSVTASTHVLEPDEMARALL
jgi:hypothetical protein